MPIKLGQVAQIKDTGGLVPEGKHVAQVTASTEEMRQDGMPQWNLTFTTEHGDVRERIAWTERAMIRGKILCGALGYDIENPASDEVVNAPDLIGKVCVIDVEHEQFVGRDDGKKHTTSRITFRGFEPAPDEVREKMAAAAASNPQSKVADLFGS